MLLNNIIKIEARSGTHNSVTITKYTAIIIKNYLSRYFTLIDSLRKKNTLKSE